MFLLFHRYLLDRPCRQSRTFVFWGISILFLSAFGAVYSSHTGKLHKEMMPQTLQLGHNIQLSQHLFSSLTSKTLGNGPSRSESRSHLTLRPVEVHLVTAFARILSQNCFYILHYSLCHLCAPRVTAEVALYAKTVSPPMLWLQSWFVLIGKTWSELPRWNARMCLQAWGPFPEEMQFSIPFSLMDVMV